MNPETPQDPSQYEPGDVFQINENYDPNGAGWIGAFIVATEIKTWGIQGYVHLIINQKKGGHAHNRLKWDQIDFIGKARLLPEYIADRTTKGDTQENINR